MSTQRQPRGIPVGGQFAANAHDEAAPLSPGYAYEQHDADFAGRPIEHLEIGERRGAITEDEGKPLTVQGFRFEGGTKIVTLIPETGYDDWTNPESRAVFLAQTENMLATVERVRDHRDWLRSKQHPLYVVTLYRSIKDPLTHERHERTLDVEFVNPRGIPTRADAIAKAVEESIRFGEYTYASDYVAESGKEYEDAMGEYAEMEERDENLRHFLGDDYRSYVLGESDTLYETKETS